MTISIQGQKGSYSHIAATSYFDEEIELLERDTFSEVFEDLKNDKCEYIVVPIENSTYGSIYQNYDNLTRYNFHIVGEVYLKINFHLIANKGAKLNELNEIYTHPVALGQIQKFLKDNNHLKVIENADTAGAVKMIKEKKMLNAAAAASKFAAKLYEMDIIKEDIHENPKNYTRFFVLSKNSDFDSNSTKTTIQFILGEEAGALYKSLRSFADRDIALTKIESRPLINTDWEYIFYVDLLAGINDEKLKNALNEFKGYVKEMRILGSYRKGNNINT